MGNDSNRSNREPISPRRAAIAEEIRTESEKPPTKKRRTVEFQGDIEKNQKPQTNDEESVERKIINKRSVLGFSVKDK